MAAQLSICRYCGAQGLEDSNDVAPGVCPRCLDSRMLVVTRRVEEHGIAGAWDGLRWAGLTDEAATIFLVDLAELMVRSVG